MKSQYKVLQSYFLKEFMEEVNEALSEGWELQGGVSTQEIPGDPTGSHLIAYCQAMVSKPTYQDLQDEILNLQDEVVRLQVEVFAWAGENGRPKSMKSPEDV
jgi:hypothetical protein